jgi:putative ABC transport system permease protein
MRTLLQDLRLALRMLRRAPGYALLVVVTLGLAMGAATTVFSVVDGVMLRPLGYRDPERLVSIWEKHPQFPEMSVSYLDFLDWRKSQRSFEDLAAFQLQGLSLSGVDRPERLEGRIISASLLPLLGVTPQLGRAFTPEEDLAGAPRVAMISDGLWKRRFGGDPAVLGRSITLSGEPHTIIGVLPPSFRFPFRFPVPVGDVYVSYARVADHPPGRGNHSGFALGRLRPGVTFERARADLEAIGRALGEKYDSNRNVQPALAPLHADVVREHRTILLVLLGSVCFVLLIAIANVANLALARSATRRKEVAVRAALGAGRWRIIRGLLLESLVLALAGASVGLLVATWGVDALRSARAESLPATAMIRLDWRVAAFAAAAALVAGVLCALAPALAATRTDVADALRKADARGGGGVAHNRLRGILVVGEVALALVLLTGAGLSIHTVLRILRVDPGFRPDGVLTARLFAPPDKYPGAPAVRGFLHQVEERIAAIPGVDSVAMSSGLPLKGSSETAFRLDGVEPVKDAELPFTVYYATTAGYAKTMGLSLLAGRWFTPSDRDPRAPVAVIDDVMANRFFPKGDAIGHHIVNFNPPLEIVGVVRHVAHYGFGVPELAPHQLYFASEQVGDEDFVGVMRGVDMTIRSRLAPDAITRAVESAVTAVDPELPVYDVKPMTTVVDEANRDRRFVMALLVGFAALAMLLATLGLYAVLAYLVAQRTHEIGVRMALGAQPGEVRRMVLGQGMRLAGVGIALGLVGALALGHLMAGMLYQIEPRDPSTLALVSLLLILTAAFASYLPSRRATRIDPMIALRSE